MRPRLQAGGEVGCDCSGPEKTYPLLQLKTQMTWLVLRRDDEAACRAAARAFFGAVGIPHFDCLRFGPTSSDPFATVKGLIEDMLVKLVKEAGDEAYCNEQLSKTAATKSEMEEDISKMTSKIDQTTARSAQ